MYRVGGCASHGVPGHTDHRIALCCWSRSAREPRRPREECPMAETMRAVVFEGAGRFAVRDVPRPTVQREDDVLLRVDACGICGTDLHIVEDPPGYPAVPGTILGHEFTATVVE